MKSPQTRLAVLAVLVTAACLAAQAAGDEWPQWRGPRGDGYWPAPPISADWPAALRLTWSQPLGPGYSGVVAAAGRVITLDRPPGDDEVERVVCFAAAHGQLLWEYRYAAAYGDLQYGKGPRAAATVHDGRVYTLGAVGHLHCLDAETGRVLWSKKLVQEAAARQPTWGFAAAPLIHGDKVIVHAGLLPRGCFVALDRRSGKEIWRAGEDPAGYCTPILIRHGGAEQLIGWTPEHVVSLAPANGRIHWQVPYKVTMGVSIATPVYHEGMVLVSGYWEGSKAIRLGSAAGEAQLVWEDNRQLRGLMSQPLCRDGYAYLLDKRHGLVCFELATGQVAWTDENRLTPAGRNPQLTLVWVGDSGRAIGLNSDGQLVLVRLDPQGFAELARSQLVGPTWAHPAYVGRRVFARDDERLVCVELPAAE